MDTLRSAAHLQREIGDELFEALTSSNNTHAVRCFAWELVMTSLPISMHIGDRTYEIITFLRDDEKSVPGQVMMERAKEMGAHLGREDCEYILNHKDEIPAVFHRKITFVFTDTRVTPYPNCFDSIFSDGTRWIKSGGGFDNRWGSYGKPGDGREDRLLRRCK
jgi:hypothetical protein